MCIACVVNLGYHCSVVNKYPHLVSQFEPLEDLKNHNPFIIGDIRKGGNNEGGTKISQIITYKTPFRVNGWKVLFSIDIGDFSTRTLLSYQFFKTPKATIIPESSILVRGLLVTAFKITIKPPLLVTEPPTAKAGVPAVLMENAPNTVSHMEDISGTLNEALQELAEDRGINWYNEGDPASEIAQ